MSQLSLATRLRFAVDDIGRALRYVVRPWADLQAVKTNHVDIINAVSAHQADIADALASIGKFGQELARLDARVAEQDARIRQLLDRVELLRRELVPRAEPGLMPSARAAGMNQHHGDEE